MSADGLWMLGWALFVGDWVWRR